MGRLGLRGNGHQPFCQINPFVMVNRGYYYLYLSLVGRFTCPSARPNDIYIRT